MPFAMIKTFEIPDISSLIATLNGFENSYIFRGQSDASWHLESSLERAIGPAWSQERARKFEEFSLLQFKSKFHLYDTENVQPQTKLSWLSLMQHYGIPTRLIDFTESPYIALYFALESCSPKTNSHIAIYAINYSALIEASLGHIRRMDGGFKEDMISAYLKRDSIFEDIIDRFSYDIVWITEPTVLNKRLDRQSGSFLLSGNRDVKIEAALNEMKYTSVDVQKLVIPTTLYSNIYALLRKMNITAKSIYGDLFGLAQSIKTEMRIYSS